MKYKNAKILEKARVLEKNIQILEKNFELKLELARKKSTKLELARTRKFDTRVCPSMYQLCTVQNL